MLRAPRTRVSVSILSTHHRSREGGPDAKRSTGVLQEALAREAAPAGRRGRPDGALRQGPGRRLDQGPRRPGEYRVQPGVLLRTRQRRPAPAARCRLRPAEAGGRRLWCVRAVRRGDLREATRGAAVRALLHRLPAGHRARGAHGHGLGARGPASRRQPAHPSLPVTLLSSLRTLVSVGFDLKRLFDRHRASPSGEDDSEATALLARAAEVSRAGRSQEAGTLYRQILQTRRIALYRQALDKAPDELALAVALGRVFFELEMLDEAADQFEKVEVRAPALPVVHAYLGAVFERRGETRAAFDEYRRALQLGHAFDWPHQCATCGATSALWQDRCPSCHRWNTLRPVRG